MSLEMRETTSNLMRERWCPPPVGIWAKTRDSVTHGACGVQTPREKWFPPERSVARLACGRARLGRRREKKVIYVDIRHEPIAFEREREVGSWGGTRGVGEKERKREWEIQFERSRH